jgi:hypothetical protein
VNTIFRGAVVGSPAYAPRTSGPLALPTEERTLEKAFAEVLADGKETKTFGSGIVPIETTEQMPADPEAKAPAAKQSGGTQALTRTAVDLPESGWPSGRFYWTVVPVYAVPKYDDGKFTLEYHEPVAPQDNCQSGKVIQFGKDSSPVLAGQGTPYASGLSPQGRLVAASGQRATFYGHPLIAWAPVQGAAGYEVQWSRSRSQWAAKGRIETEGTAAVLPVKPGEWWYRVRARNPYLPGSVKRMAWSTPHRIVVAKPRFAVVRG